MATTGGEAAELTSCCATDPPSRRSSACPAPTGRSRCRSRTSVEDFEAKAHAFLHGGIPRQRVIGSSAALAYTSDERGGTTTHKAEADYLDDGPEKPIRIWSRTGRRPLLAAGDSNGDVPMLHFTQHSEKPALRLLVLHDDEREIAYTGGAEHALEQAASDGWTVVSVTSDWATVF